MIQKILLSLALVLGFLSFVPPQTANAALFDGSTREACRGAQLSRGGGAGCGGAGQKVNSTLQRIINLITIIVGIVAVIMILFNGFRFITSGGDANQVASARNGLIYAIVGLVVVAFAQIIVRFVINRL